MKLRKYQNSEGLNKYFDIRLAIIDVEPGETDEEAWNRHVKEHPEERNVNIRIFNRKTEVYQTARKLARSRPYLQLLSIRR